MRSNEVLPSTPKKGYSTRTTASIVLGAISTTSASIALIMTFELRDQIKEVSGGGGWVFIFGFLVIPLMFLSFITLTSASSDDFTILSSTFWKSRENR